MVASLRNYIANDASKHFILVRILSSQRFQCKKCGLVKLSKADIAVLPLPHMLVVLQASIIGITSKYIGNILSLTNCSYGNLSLSVRLGSFSKRFSEVYPLFEAATKKTKKVF